MNYAKRIEVEITLRCNLRCSTCSRHCGVYTQCDDSDMTSGQLERFMTQVEAKGDTWDTIAIMGGEPTLHPRFNEIVEGMWTRLVEPGLVDLLQVWTNGLIPIKLPMPTRFLRFTDESHPDGHVHVIAADHKLKPHYQAFLAPKDTGQVRAPCTSVAVCGIALNAGGYWPCGPAGAIARLFGWQDYVKTELPNDAGDWDDLEPFCELCQQAVATKIPVLGFWGEDARREISPTYVKAIKAFVPRLRRW